MASQANFKLNKRILIQQPFLHCVDGTWDANYRVIFLNLHRGRAGQTVERRAAQRDVAGLNPGAAAICPANG